MPVIERPTPEESLERVRTALGDLAEDVVVNFGHVDVVCKPEAFVDVVRTLRDDTNLECVFFTFLSAVDRTAFGGTDKAEKAGVIEVLCHVYAPDRALHVNVHVPLDLENLVCPTITGVYAGADWHERETSEMFGILFEGHPNPVKLYLPEDFEGHPLRKTFKLPSRLIKDWPGAKDPEEAAAGGRG